jgi:hypothetical protein
VKDAIYTLFWRTGQREIVKGRNPAEAMTLAGYGGGAVRALDFYARGNNDEYAWNKITREWDAKTSALTPDNKGAK